MGAEAMLMTLSIVYTALMISTIAYWYKVRWTYGGDRGIRSASDTPDGRYHFRRLMGLSFVTSGTGGGLMVSLPSAG
jgi:hypothetical protein